MRPIKELLKELSIPIIGGRLSVMEVIWMCTLSGFITFILYVLLN